MARRRPTGTTRPRISYDRHGTPAVWARNASEAYEGIGFLHGFHRPLQTLLAACAGRAELSRLLAPRPDLVEIDALAHRLDVPGIAEREARRLSAQAGEWLDAYLRGCQEGLERRGLPLELRVLVTRLAPPNRTSILGSLLLAAYLGLAGGQERMERALVDAVAAGADPALLEAMFHPHLKGWDPAALRPLARQASVGSAAHGLLRPASGSNAWAVSGERTASGKPFLCGDPHLQVNQLPSLLFELRARVGDDYWLGATIPGLPGVAVGRNRHLAWSGTFAVADNVDFTIETLDDGSVRRPRGAHVSVLRREVEIRRRWQTPLRLRFFSTDRGALEAAPADGSAMLASRWAGAERAAEAVEAYMALPLAKNVAEAQHVLERAYAFSLHFVLADREGRIGYCQAGRIPRRSEEWSGLYPARGDSEQAWVGFYEGSALPREICARGWVASANEARTAPDGSALATLAQPDYRRDRIEGVLAASTRVDLAAMQRLQLDVSSLQAARLRPRLLSALPDSPLKKVLTTWDGRYDAQSHGAHAFEIAYRAALMALAPELGGEWLESMLEGSELGVWWCAGFDSVLAAPESWSGSRGERLRQALASRAHVRIEPWGEVQRLRLSHVVFGGLPFGGFDRGPYPLPGSRATVRQGTLVRVGGRELVTAPAYRFICDLGEDRAMTSLPGGIDGSRFSPSYDCWLAEWLSGAYHVLEPPGDDERLRV